jgi:hypothetical protein
MLVLSMSTTSSSASPNGGEDQLIAQYGSCTFMPWRSQKGEKLEISFRSEEHMVKGLDVVLVLCQDWGLDFY